MCHYPDRKSAGRAAQVGRTVGQPHEAQRPLQGLDQDSYQKESRAGQSVRGLGQEGAAKGGAKRVSAEDGGAQAAVPQDNKLSGCDVVRGAQV